MHIQNYICLNYLVFVLEYVLI